MMNREKQKKNRKHLNISKIRSRSEGFDKIPVPEDLDQRVRAGIEEGKRDGRK